MVGYSSLRSLQSFISGGNGMGRPNLPPSNAPIENERYLVLTFMGDHPITSYHIRVGHDLFLHLAGM